MGDELWSPSHRLGTAAVFALRGSLSTQNSSRSCKFHTPWMSNEFCLLQAQVIKLKCWNLSSEENSLNGRSASAQPFSSQSLSLPICKMGIEEHCRLSVLLWRLNVVSYMSATQGHTVPFLPSLPHPGSILTPIQMNTATKECRLTAEISFSVLYCPLPNCHITQGLCFFLGAGDNQTGEMLSR